MRVTIRVAPAHETASTVLADYVTSPAASDPCAVPGKGSHNNTIRTLERSLLAADTDGYADTESGTSHECAVRVLKGLQRLEHYVLTHNLSQVDLSAAWTGQQRFQGSC